MTSRATLLLIAAQLLEARHRPGQVIFSDDEGCRFHARLSWPGVVIVTYADDGEEVVRSLPGDPTSPSDAATPYLVPR